ncbi:MAG: hypothetical protein J3K34DRAFT_196831 [Monoraphidium minutum]|nr:MAG: hypothetical protein J3K34DRAFT_196831 [Monoraphidium minutum]
MARATRSARATAALHIVGSRMPGWHSTPFKLKGAGPPPPPGRAAVKALRPVRAQKGACFERGSEKLLTPSVGLSNATFRHRARRGQQRDPRLSSRSTPLMGAPSAWVCCRAAFRSAPSPVLASAPARPRRRSTQPWPVCAPARSPTQPLTWPGTCVCAPARAPVRPLTRPVWLARLALWCYKCLWCTALAAVVAAHPCCGTVPCELAGAL